jgi:hypothetical protein
MGQAVRKSSVQAPAAQKSSAPVQAAQKPLVSLLLSLPPSAEFAVRVPE